MTAKPRLRYIYEEEAWETDHYGVRQLSDIYVPSLGCNIPSPYLGIVIMPAGVNKHLAKRISPPLAMFNHQDRDNIPRTYWLV